MSAHELITDHLDLWTGAVTQKRSGGRVNNGKIELTGIRKLRELILELAVRGKLVEQDPDDEPASVLLERIAEEKARLVKEGKIKKPKKFPEISEEEMSFEVSRGWNWCRLGEIAEVIRGVTYKKHDAASEPAEGHIALLRANNIQDSINNFDVLYIPRNLAKGDQVIRKGDILIAMSSGSANLVGKAAQASQHIDATFGAFCGLIRAHCSDIGSYLGFYTSTPAYRGQAQKAGKGIGINNLNKKSLDMMLVPVPPLEEQHRIVEKVDELMALCDRLEQQVGDQLEAHELLVDTLLDALTRSADAAEVAESWARIAEHFDTLFTTEASIDKLKQAILQLAVMGRLVEQDPKDEPASVLLEKIAAEKARLFKEGNYRKQKSLEKNEREESLYPTPPSWKWETIDSISIVQGGIQKQPKRAPRKNHYPYLRVADVQRGSLSDCAELPRFELSDSEIEQYKLDDADILIVEGNGSADEIGRCAIWDGRISNCVYQNHLIRVRPAYEGLSKFIALFLNSPSGIEEMKRLAVTTSGLYNLSVGKIRNIMIPIAPLAEEHRIVDKVEELMALCDQLKARLADASKTRTHLAEAVVEQAVS